MLIKSLIVILIYALVICCATDQKTPAAAPDRKLDLKKDWRLGMQLWTFQKYSFMEALEKTAALDLKWVEAFPGQRLFSDSLSTRFDPFMNDEHKQLIKAKLKEQGLRLVNFGVVALPNDEQECRFVFDFAKEMGIETIISEPPEEAWDLIERLCEEYKINVAIHDHPKPTCYWNPDKVASIISGRSSYIGACADIGHWMRSGVNPVKALRILEGRILDFHFGDLNSFGDLEAHDVIWGSGEGEIEKILDEMRRQKYRGLISIEYEYNWTTSIPEIEQSIAFFNNYVEKHNLKNREIVKTNGSAE